MAFILRKNIFWALVGLSFIFGKGMDINATAVPSSHPLKSQEISSLTPAIHHTGLDVSIGNQYAPMTIMMYYSLTCPHCHEFQEKILPEIQKQYIDKGLVRFIFRDFPTDGLALQAVKIAWCMGKDHYIRISKRLLASQETWAHSSPDPKDSLKALYEVAAQCGINPELCQKCLDDKKIEETILHTSFEAQKTYSLEYAPAFIINGKIFEGTLTPESIHEMLIKMGIHWKE